MGMNLRVFLLLVCLSAAKKSLYDVLQVSRNASDKEIKSKFRELSRTHHPDKNKDNPKASEEFAEITHAYQILSDPEKKQKYDISGDDSAGGGQGSFSFSDLFGGSFGGSSFFEGFFQEGKTKRTPDQEIHLAITLEDVCRGGLKQVTHKRKKICTACFGLGARSKKDVQTCLKCKGSGQEVKHQSLGGFFIQQVMVECSHCNGKGKSIKRKCRTCTGARTITEIETLTVKVVAGVDDKTKIHFREKADEHPDHKTGDCVVVLNIQPEKNLTARGKDLLLTVPITLLEALADFKKTQLLPDGTKLVLDDKEIITPETKSVFRGRGLPRMGSSRRGNVVVTYEIKFPRQVRNKKLLREALEPIERTDL